MQVTISNNFVSIQKLDTIKCLGIAFSSAPQYFSTLVSRFLRCTITHHCICSFLRYHYICSFLHFHHHTSLYLLIPAFSPSHITVSAHSYIVTFTHHCICSFTITHHCICSFTITHHCICSTLTLPPHFVEHFLAFVDPFIHSSLQISASLPMPRLL